MFRFRRPKSSQRPSFLSTSYPFFPPISSPQIFFFFRQRYIGHDSRYHLFPLHPILIPSFSHVVPLPPMGTQGFSSLLQRAFGLRPLVDPSALMSRTLFFAFDSANRKKVLSSRGFVVTRPYTSPAALRIFLTFSTLGRFTLR